MVLRQRQPVPDRVVAGVRPVLCVFDEVAQQVPLDCGRVVANAPEAAVERMCARATPRKARVDRKRRKEGCQLSA